MFYSFQKKLTILSYSYHQHLFNLINTNPPFKHTDEKCTIYPTHIPLMTQIRSISTPSSKCKLNVGRQVHQVATWLNSEEVAKARRYVAKQEPASTPKQCGDTTIGGSIERMGGKWLISILDILLSSFFTTSLLDMNKFIHSPYTEQTPQAYIRGASDVRIKPWIGYPITQPKLKYQVLLLPLPRILALVRMVRFRAFDVSSDFVPFLCTLTQPGLCEVSNIGRVVDTHHRNNTGLYELVVDGLPLGGLPIPGDQDGERGIEKNSVEDPLFENKVKEKNPTQYLGLWAQSSFTLESARFPSNYSLTKDLPKKAKHTSTIEKLFYGETLKVYTQDKMYLYMKKRSSGIEIGNHLKVKESLKHTHGLMWNVEVVRSTTDTVDKS